MPDNAFYYRAAYAALAVLYSAYTLSVILRRRALARRAERQAGRNA